LVPSGTGFLLASAEADGEAGTDVARTKVPLGVVEGVNGNIKALLRRGRGYRDLNYLLGKAQRLAATKTQFIAFTESRLKCGPRQILAQNLTFQIHVAARLSD
jgi:hypothetical protein